MTWDAQGIVELLQGLVTRAIIAIFKRMIKDLTWQVIGAQEEDFRRSKNLSTVKCASRGIQGNKLLFYGVMGQRDHALFVNVLHQAINLDRNHFLVVQDLFHAILVFISHDADLWNNCDSLGVANHQNFGFLENKSYRFDGSLFSLLGDHFVKFQEEGLLENLSHGLNFLPVEITFKTLFERAFAFKFFHLHYKEFLVWKKFEDRIRSCFRISDTNIYLLDKSIRRIVKTYSYMISSLETFVIALKGIGFFENHFLNVKVQLEDPCDNQKFLNGLEVLKAFLIENILSFQSYHLHFKESMFLLIFENKKKDGFGVLKVCLRTFVETILRKDFLELLLKNFVEKHHCCFKTFIEIRWKDVFLDGMLVPNKNSLFISMKHEFSGTLLYHLPFKEFLKKFVCE
ncbi:hypothetical protein M9H77_06961 [Catharanthus roseus]|uniref:Uncharacterized protein n=1 Tax=Catharanthus roseus TaxID=4058 RepID=A0ACC0BTP2_CATRO|nr:hypothetical protein M9H77_06961 [Catharanthus roseus]